MKYDMDMCVSLATCLRVFCVHEWYILFFSEYFHNEQCRDIDNFQVIKAIEKRRTFRKLNFLSKIKRLTKITFFKNWFIDANYFDIIWRLNYKYEWDIEINFDRKNGNLQKMINLHCRRGKIF